MFNITAKSKEFAINEDPPWLKKGKFVPLLGRSPDTTPKFKNAWKLKINVKIIPK